MKIIQLGVGGWGKNHVRILSELEFLCGVFDTDMTKSKEYAEKYHVDWFESIDDIVNYEFDGVVICTPTKTHYDLAKIFLHHKKHVFVEKPLTYSSAQGMELVNLAKQNNVILTCGYIERFNPSVIELKKFIESEKYGKLLSLEFHRENRVPQHINDVGIIFDTTVHDIDTANYLFGANPMTVFAISQKTKHVNEDFVTAILGYENNRTATIISNWVTSSRVRTFRAVFTDGIIHGDFILQAIRIETKNKIVTLKNPREEPLLAELKHFAGCIKNKTFPLVTPDEAVMTTQIAESILSSSQKGTLVYIRPKNPILRNQNERC